MNWRVGLLVALSLTVSVAHAAPAQAKAGAPAARGPAGMAMLPEVVGAKAFLEDMLSRRFSQELSTMVERPGFSLGVELDLAERAKPKEPDPDAAPETPPDLVLGMLDPDALLKKYAGDESASWGDGILRGYIIKTVAVSVGLRENLGPEVRSQVDKWLSGRLKGEFGAAGKSTVTVLHTLEDKKAAPPKSPLDWLTQFQALAGQALLALAILLGTLLWKLLTSKDVTTRKSEGEAPSAPAPAPAVAAPPPAPPVDEKKEEEEKEPEKDRVTNEAERVNITKEIRQLAKRISTLLPRVAQDLEGIIRAWCQAGEDGKTKLAILIDALGESKMTERLPIPVDSIEDLTKIFMRMAETSDFDKLGVLKKVYWDLLMALNLGADALEQPFGYLGALTPPAVDGLLLKQNPKMKAVVALYLPADLRDKYMRSIDVNAKRELLEIAAEMDVVAADEIRTFDGELKNTILQSGQQGTKTVPFRPLLGKLVAPLTASEQVTLLAGMSGGSVEEYRRQNASLAFVGFWPDDKLTILLSRAQSDELVAFLRVRPELQERLLKLSPPMTSEVAQDELTRPDTLSEADRDRLIGALNDRLKEMVANSEADLEAIFSATQAAQSEDDTERAA